MKKNKVKIKDNLSIIEKAAAINYIVDACFYNGEYKPYYFDMAVKDSIVEFFLDGLEFDKTDQIYDIINTDEEIQKLVNKFYIDKNETQKTQTINKRNEKYIEILDFVKDNALKIIDFRKAFIIHNGATFFLENEGDENDIKTNTTTVSPEDE